MKTRPILNIQEINPMLYRYVEELREVGVRVGIIEMVFNKIERFSITIRLSSNAKLFM
jgi:hypothetical protein